MSSGGEFSSIQNRPRRLGDWHIHAMNHRYILRSSDHRINPSGTLLVFLTYKNTRGMNKASRMVLRPQEELQKLLCVRLGMQGVHDQVTPSLNRRESLPQESEYEGLLGPIDDFFLPHDCRTHLLVWASCHQSLLCVMRVPRV